jgi:hypothetical protein
MDTIGIPNAPWWLNNSTVVIKGLFLAEDDAWLTNQISASKVQNAGTSNMTLETNVGNQNILKIQRMVTQGTVAIMLKGGNTYTVELPKEAGKLLPPDANYILAQIDALGRPMSAEEQEAFLASVEEHSQANLTRVK